MIHQQHITAKSPNDGLWYALGLLSRDNGKPYYIPVSKGYKHRKEAVKYAKLQPAIDKATAILGAKSI